jgi:hypothetical protein
VGEGLVSACERLSTVYVCERLSTVCERGSVLCVCERLSTVSDMLSIVNESTVGCERAPW